MTSALELLTDAATTAGVIDPRDPLADADAQFILRRLNRLIKTWANERLMLFNTYVDQLPLVANQASYLSSLLANGNASQWDSAFVRQSAIDYTLALIDKQTYNAIGYKQTASIPEFLYVDTNWPNSTLYFFPVPSGAMTAHISARGPLTQTLLLATDVSLPPGYEAALVDNLAVDISPSYGRQPTQQLIETAKNQKMVLKRNNAVALEMQMPAPLRRGAFNVFSG